MSSQDISNLINAVLVAATFAIVVIAGRTVREAKRTTAELKTLVQTAKDTAASSATTMQAARDTAEISQAALDAAERYRQLEQLRAVHRLILEILQEARHTLAIEKANPRTYAVDPRWRCIQQNQARHSSA